MAALLTTDTAAVLCHVLVDILIAHSGLGIANALFVKSLIQTKVGHNGSNNGVGQELATLFHIAAIDVQNMIASNDIAFLVHTQAAICIAIIGKTYVQALLDDKLLQTLNVSGSRIVVDIQAIRLVIDDVGICAESIKDRFGEIPGASIRTIQTDLDTLEGVDAQRDQVAHIAVAACHIVHSAADVLTMGKGQLRPVLVKYMELAIDVVLHQQQSFFWHFLAVTVDQLDTVIVVRIVAGRDHDTAVEIIHTSDVGHGRGGGNMKQISVCTGSSQARDQAVLKHIRTATMRAGSVSPLRSRRAL